MRAPLFLGAVALVVVMVAVPTQACAQGVIPVGGGDYPNCPQYTLTVGEAGTSISTDPYGRLLIDLNAAGLQPYAGYIVIDEPSLYGQPGYLFAITQYSETNGVPGLQRLDELCQHVENWWEADEILFIC